MFKSIIYSALQIGVKATVAVTSTKYLEFLLFSLLDALVSATKFTQFDDKALAAFKEAYYKEQKEK